MTGNAPSSSFLPNNVITKGAFTINLSDYSVSKNGEKIELTAKEFDILKLLMKNPKKVCGYVCDAGEYRFGDAGE